MNLHLTDSLTSNAPPWLVLTFLVIGVSAYATCALTTLAARARRRWRQHRADRRVVLTQARQLPPARTEVTS